MAFPDPEVCLSEMPKKPKRPWRLLQRLEGESAEVVAPLGRPRQSAFFLRMARSLKSCPAAAWHRWGYPWKPVAMR